MLLTALAEPRVKVAIEWYLIEMLDVFEWVEWQFGKFRGRNRKGVDLLIGLIPKIVARFKHVNFIIGGDGDKMKLL